VPQACGCCGFTVSHAWQLRTRENAAWGSCDFANRSNAEHPKWSQQHGSPIDGPFPYAAGLFYGVSAPVVKWLAESPFFANALRSLRRSVWSARMRYTEDLVFGWVMRQVPELTTVVLGQGDGDAFDNFDAAGGVQRAFRQASECYLRYRLTVSNFTTGSFSKWGACCPEWLTPRQVLTHHVLDKAQWQRASAMAKRWAKLPADPCLTVPLRRVAGPGTESETSA